MATKNIKNITKVQGSAVFLPGDDIDTDRIIPARFLKCVSFEGMGQYAFYDDRYEKDGQQKEHPLNEKEAKGAKFLVSGCNFGCGSSREHAPQALYRAGFRAILAESFADIFFSNCTGLGLVCAKLSTEHLNAIFECENEGNFSLDLEKLRLSAGNLVLPFEIPPPQREALLSGSWDPLTGLLDNLQEGKNTEKTLPYSSWWFGDEQ